MHYKETHEQWWNHTLNHHHLTEHAQNTWWLKYTRKLNPIHRTHHIKYTHLAVTVPKLNL